VVCEKRGAGESVDLKTHGFVLFSGQVRIYPAEPNSPFPQIHLDLSARGLSEEKTTVGIFTPDEPASIDGEVAHVLADSVLVLFPRQILLDLQLRHEKVHNAWGALWGTRRGEIKRRIRNFKATH
jgi:hypothetical protein